LKHENCFFFSILPKRTVCFWDDDAVLPLHTILLDVDFNFKIDEADGIAEIKLHHVGVVLNRPSNEKYKYE